MKHRHPIGGRTSYFINWEAIFKPKAKVYSFASHFALRILQKSEQDLKGLKEYLKRQIYTFNMIQ